MIVLRQNKGIFCLKIGPKVESSQQDIFKFPMVLEEETQQKLEISSEKTTRKGKFPFYASEILGNCAFPLSFHRENSNEILIFFAVAVATAMRHKIASKMKQKGLQREKITHCIYTWKGNFFAYPAL